MERRCEQALDVIDAPQRHLLPEGVPVLPGVRIAASYLRADAGAAAGGDWFDAVALAGDRITRGDAGRAAGRVAGAQSDPLLVLEQPGAPGPRTRVDGPVDAATTAAVRREVLFAPPGPNAGLVLSLVGTGRRTSDPDPAQEGGD
ncbi:hypothetical protein [Actinosynnema pretiosum]|uniref:Uncharacterized protein n=1 Tax=Actinosynnema pretiosum TaxID=42197 RepID=A0A290Z6T4_9PSEU|nr:hypothetical protein [Actinosynnema pretiosum]ATE54704.1 hypothetical protein CNX65_16630 [Actinosynnema pretiosum]